MPRGWLKHKGRRVGQKASRGGSSHHSSKQNNEKKQNQKKVDKSSAPTRRNLKPHRRTTIRKGNICCLIEEDSWKDDHDFSQEVELHSPHDSENQNESTTIVHKSNEEQQCPICCEIRPLLSLMKKCNHPPTCRDCLYEIYVSQAQQNVSNYPLQCYHPGCSKPILATQLIHHNIFRSDLELRKHQRFSLLGKAYSNPRKKIAHCPDCDFPHLVSSQNNVCCKRCKSRYEVAHDHSHNKKTTIKALEAIERDKIGVNYGWTYCPGCKIIVSKGHGCNHMTCVCGEQFYWDTIVLKPELKMAVAEKAQINVE
jgi:hypothetical protein